MPRAPVRPKPRKKPTLPTPRRRKKITEEGIEMLTEEYVKAYNLAPADARARVLRDLQLTRKR